MLSSVRNIVLKVEFHVSDVLIPIGSCDPIVANKSGKVMLVIRKKRVPWFLR